MPQNFGTDPRIPFFACEFHITCITMYRIRTPSCNTTQTLKTFDGRFITLRKLVDVFIYIIIHVKGNLYQYFKGRAPTFMGPQFTMTPGQPLHIRVNCHCYDIAHRITEKSPVVEHFSSGAHVESDKSVMVIELTRSLDTFVQKIRESRWIRTLGTSPPLGMNLRVSIVCKSCLLHALGCLRAIHLYLPHHHPEKIITILLMYLHHSL